MLYRYADNSICHGTISVFYIINEHIIIYSSCVTLHQEGVYPHGIAKYLSLPTFRYVNNAKLASCAYAFFSFYLLLRRTP